MAPPTGAAARGHWPVEHRPGRGTLSGRQEVGGNATHIIIAAAPTLGRPAPTGEGSGGRQSELCCCCCCWWWWLWCFLCCCCDHKGKSATWPDVVKEEGRFSERRGEDGVCGAAAGQGGDGPALYFHRGCRCPMAHYPHGQHDRQESDEPLLYADVEAEYQRPQGVDQGGVRTLGKAGRAGPIPEERHAQHRARSGGQGGRPGHHEQALPQAHVDESAARAGALDQPARIGRGHAGGSVSRLWRRPPLQGRGAAPGHFLS